MSIFVNVVTVLVIPGLSDSSGFISTFVSSSRSVGSVSSSVDNVDDDDESAVRFEVNSLSMGSSLCLLIFNAPVSQLMVILAFDKRSWPISTSNFLGSFSFRFLKDFFDFYSVCQNRTK